MATLAIIFSSLCFGLVPLFARELQALGTQPASIALYRFGATALVLLPFLPVSREKRRQALALGLAGLLVGVGWTGYLRAIESAPVAVAGVVYMSYPAFALGFAWLLLGQRPGRRSLAAYGLVAASALLLAAGADGRLDLAALAWVLPAPVSFGLLIVILSAMVPRLGALEKMASVMLGSLLGLTPLAVSIDPDGLVPATHEAWLAIAGLALATGLVPQLVYTVACVRVGPARSAAAGCFELPMVIAIGWLAFSEPLGLREAVAAGLVILAILLAPAVRPGVTIAAPIPTPPARRERPGLS